MCNYLAFSLMLSNIKCQGSSSVRVLPLFPMISGSNPSSAKLSFRVRTVASSP